MKPYLLSLLLLGPVLPACDRGPYEIVPVSGTVSLDGEPLADALVSFQPIGVGASNEPGPGSFARTGEDGRYSLKVVEPERPGAVVGPHRVLISTATSGGGDGDRTVGERVPRRYRDGNLQFRVPEGGTAEANFELHTVEPVK